ncbi:glycosylase [Maribacter sp. ANRC-HE7]|uniref:Glycosylase n=1 Tax=Maribacter aquimaris TaxID=2737171 RepID=A0ABR7UVH0_9FLAO|nr:glycosylase [Maribacter aquimaris]MBD0776385.1 glycosylase [Maribacter aquimaris]
MKTNLLILISAILFCSCQNKSKKQAEKNDIPGISAVVVDTIPFPDELVDFETASENPLFEGTGEATWDQSIRERGYILKEGDTYHMWYSGERVEDEPVFLGYATSTDGISWKRYSDKPIFDESWTEDMMVIKVDGIYHMFAEGKNDRAHRLSSKDGIHWEDHEVLDIRNSDGSPLSEGPFGTTTVWRENNLWYLFYERNDLGVWLATSKDLKTWTNVQDDPVIAMGPETYDKYGLAVDQIIKYKGWYYAYYHGTSFEDWHDWSTNVAASKDLVHWKKYGQNPIMGGNRSSGLLVPDGDKFRLYTMHRKVEVHYPKNESSK